MTIIYVDDEPIALQNFVLNMQSLMPNQRVYTFSNGEDALNFACKEKVDVAFLDINMHPNGIEMGQQLRKINADIKLVFLTAYNNFASEAFRLEAVDYLLKPCDKTLLKKTLLKLGVLTDEQKKNKIYFRTMPNLGVFINDERILLRGSKVKEVLAYLISVEGREVSNRELLRNVWQKDDIDGDALVLVRMTIKNLREKLKEYGIEDILLSEYGEYCLDTRKFSSDLQELRNGNENVIKQYDGRFLEEYSWAEVTNASIAESLNWDWE